MQEYGWPETSTAGGLTLFDEQNSVNKPTTSPELQDNYPTLDHYNICHNFGYQYPNNNATTEQFLHSQQIQPMSAATLFSPLPQSNTPLSYEMQHQPIFAKIGLDLGVRTYFASSSLSRQSEVSSFPANRNRRRRTRTARCQAEGCGADLTYARHYHRRHKVCEFHSKAAVVVAAGKPQRFCQQCSRFHLLVEFDQGKRSCRKRLADHNRRRRKSQDLISTTTTLNSQYNDNTINYHMVTNTSKTSTTTSSSTIFIAPKPHEMVLFTTSSNNNNNNTTLSPTTVKMPALLELGCGTTNASTNLSSHVETSPPSMITFMSQLSDYDDHGGNEHKFSDHWDDDEDGCSLRGLFQISK